MLEICIQTSYDQNVQLNLKSYLPVVYGTTLKKFSAYSFAGHCLFVLVLLAIVLSVLRFTASDYYYGIVKHFVRIKETLLHIDDHQGNMSAKFASNCPRSRQKD